MIWVARLGDFATFWCANFTIVKEILNKLIPLMVRQAHHERNQPFAVRPESFDTCRRILSKDFSDFP